MRVELNPTRSPSYGIGLEDVRAALAAANANRPKGAIDGGERGAGRSSTNDQLRTADEYRPLIVAYRNGAPVRLADVAEVERLGRGPAHRGLANGKPPVLVIIYRQPGANIIETVDRVRGAAARAAGARSRRRSTCTVVLDRTTTIRASLHDVEHTLLISIVLVVLVVFAVPAQTCAPTLIPASRCRCR